jgi:hypothetical protein
VSRVQAVLLWLLSGSIEPARAAMRPRQRAAGRIITNRMKTPQQTPPNVSERNARLKAALQANMARRKAQARAREAVAKDETPAGPKDPAQE